MVSAGHIISATGVGIIAQLWATPNAVSAPRFEAFEAVSAWASDLNASSSGSAASNMLALGARVQNVTPSSSDEAWDWSHLTQSIRGLATAEWYRPQSEIRLIKDTELSQIKVNMDAEWAGLADKVESWADLPDDWDGDDGVSPSPAVINAAVTFAHRAGYSSLPKPDLYIAGDGEIGFRWTTGDDFASVAFLEDGHVVVYCSQGAGEKPLKLDVAVEEAPDFELLFKGLTRFVVA